MHIALYQPDIPQNAGNIMRTGACLAVPLHIIEPAGFDSSDGALKRAGLDYLQQADITRHASFADFEDWRRGAGSRLIALTTKAAKRHIDFSFAKDDILLLGRESAGLPDDVHARADARVKIPMASGMRSINVAAACAMVLGEGLRQTNLFPS